MKATEFLKVMNCPHCFKLRFIYFYYMFMSVCLHVCLYVCTSCACQVLAEARGIGWCGDVLFVL